MILRVVLIRAKDGKRIEVTRNVTSLKRVINTFKLFYPNLYKACALYDEDDKLLYKKGEI